MEDLFHKSGVLAAVLATAALAVCAQSPEREETSVPRARGFSMAQSTSASANSSQEVSRGAKAAPADENQAIAKSVSGLQTIPGSDVQVGYHFEPAKGWYEFQNGTLSWRDPLANETHYLLISVQDSDDKRILPGCKVVVRLTGPDNRELVSSTTLSFHWDPQFYQYAGNVALPENLTSVTLSLQVEPPALARNDRALGTFFTQPVATTWSDVTVPQGRKPGAAAKPSESPERGLFREGRHPAVEPTPYPGAK